jgi:hypothetical protein
VSSLALLSGLMGIRKELLIVHGAAVARHYGLDRDEIRQAVTESIARTFPGLDWNVEHEVLPGRFGGIRLTLLPTNSDPAVHALAEGVLRGGLAEVRSRFELAAEAIGRSEKSGFDWRSYRVTEIPIHVSVPKAYASLGSRDQYVVIQEALLRAFPAFLHNGIRENFYIVDGEPSHCVALRLLSPMRLGLTVEDFRGHSGRVSVEGLELGTESRLGKEVAREVALTRRIPPAQRPFLRECEVEFTTRSLRGLTDNEIHLAVGEALRMSYPEAPSVAEQFMCDYDREAHTLCVLVAMPRAFGEVSHELKRRVSAALPLALHELSDPEVWVKREDDVRYGIGGAVSVELEITGAAMVKDRPWEEVQQLIRQTLERCFPTWVAAAPKDSIGHRWQDGRLTALIDVPISLAPPLYGRVSKGRRRSRDTVNGSRRPGKRGASDA